MSSPRTGFKVTSSEAKTGEPFATFSQSGKKVDSEDYFPIKLHLSISMEDVNRYPEVLQIIQSKLQPDVIVQFKHVNIPKLEKDLSGLNAFLSLVERVGQALGEDPIDMKALIEIKDSLEKDKILYSENPQTNEYVKNLITLVSQTQEKFAEDFGADAKGYISLITGMLNQRKTEAERFIKEGAQFTIYLKPNFDQQNDRQRETLEKFIQDVSKELKATGIQPMEKIPGSDRSILNENPYFSITQERSFKKEVKEEDIDMESETPAPTVYIPAAERALLLGNELESSPLFQYLIRPAEVKSDLTSTTSSSPTLEPERKIESKIDVSRSEDLARSKIESDIYWAIINKDFLKLLPLLVKQDNKKFLTDLNSLGFDKAYLNSAIPTMMDKASPDELKSFLGQLPDRIKTPVVRAASPLPSEEQEGETKEFDVPLAAKFALLAIIAETPLFPDKTKVTLQDSLIENLPLAGKHALMDMLGDPTSIFSDKVKASLLELTIKKLPFGDIRVLEVKEDEQEESVSLAEWQTLGTNLLKGSALLFDAKGIAELKSFSEEGDLSRSTNGAIPNEMPIIREKGKLIPPMRAERYDEFVEATKDSEHYGSSCFDSKGKLKSWARPFFADEKSISNFIKTMTSESVLLIQDEKKPGELSKRCRDSFAAAGVSDALEEHQGNSKDFIFHQLQGAATLGIKYAVDTFMQEQNKKNENKLADGESYLWSFEAISTMVNSQRKLYLELLEELEKFENNERAKDLPNFKEIAGLGREAYLKYRVNMSIDPGSALELLRIANKVLSAENKEEAEIGKNLLKKEYLIYQKADGNLSEEEQEKLVELRRAYSALLNLGEFHRLTSPEVKGEEEKKSELNKLGDGLYKSAKKLMPHLLESKNVEDTKIFSSLISKAQAYLQAPNNEVIMKNFIDYFGSHQDKIKSWEDVTGRKSFLYEVNSFYKEVMQKYKPADLELLTQYAKQHEILSSIRSGLVERQDKKLAEMVDNLLRETTITENNRQLLIMARQVNSVRNQPLLYKKLLHCLEVIDPNSNILQANQNITKLKSQLKNIDLILLSFSPKEANKIRKSLQQNLKGYAFPTDLEAAVKTADAQFKNLSVDWVTRDKQKHSSPSALGLRKDSEYSSKYIPDRPAPTQTAPSAWSNLKTGALWGASGGAIFGAWVGGAGLLLGGVGALITVPLGAFLGGLIGGFFGGVIGGIADIVSSVTARPELPSQEVPRVPAVESESKEQKKVRTPSVPGSTRTFTGYPLNIPRTSITPAPPPKEETQSETKNIPRTSITPAPPKEETQSETKESSLQEQEGVEPSVDKPSLKPGSPGGGT